MNYLKVTFGIFVVLGCNRFIPHPPNFKSLLALEFYIPAFFWKKIYSCFSIRFCGYWLVYWLSFINNFYLGKFIFYWIFATVLYERNYFNNIWIFTGSLYFFCNRINDLSLLYQLLFIFYDILVFKFLFDYRNRI